MNDFYVKSVSGLSSLLLLPTCLSRLCSTEHSEMEKSLGLFVTVINTLYKKLSFVLCNGTEQNYQQQSYLFGYIH